MQNPIHSPDLRTPLVRSRHGLAEFSLSLNPITVGYQLALHEIGPVSRNPERDTQRSPVVRAWSLSLAGGKDTLAIKG
jgi:hypothetical protein